MDRGPRVDHAVAFGDKQRPRVFEGVGAGHTDVDAPKVGTSKKDPRENRARQAPPAATRPKPASASETPAPPPPRWRRQSCPPPGAEGWRYSAKEWSDTRQAGSHFLQLLDEHIDKVETVYQNATTHHEPWRWWPMTPSAFMSHGAKLSNLSPTQCCAAIQAPSPSFWVRCTPASSSFTIPATRP